MKIIDINNWKGRKHYLWFKEYPVHYYSVTNKLDISNFYRYIKANNLPFFISIMYLVTKALNQIEEFRLREINNEVVLYDVIHPAYTVMTSSGVFDNCDNLYDDDYQTFKAYADTAITKAKVAVNEETSYNDYSRLDQFYISSLPWIDFTGVTQPMPNDATVTVPRIVWGKYHYEGDKMVLAISIQVSHMFVDGYPLSSGFIKIQELLNEPERYLK